MEGYFIPEESDSQTGCLRISVINLPELNEIINRAKKEADQLQSTIDQLKRFELKIYFDTKSVI